jgi:hypothetical protein
MLKNCHGNFLNALTIILFTFTAFAFNKYKVIYALVISINIAYLSPACVSKKSPCSCSNIYLTNSGPKKGSKINTY